MNKSKSLREEQKTIDQSEEKKEKKKLLIDYEQFAEKTIKDFEKIGAKPSNYAKYLVKKYKEEKDLTKRREIAEKLNDVLKELKKKKVEE